MTFAHPAPTTPPGAPRSRASRFAHRVVAAPCAALCALIAAAGGTAGTRPALPGVIPGTGTAREQQPTGESLVGLELVPPPELRAGSESLLGVSLRIEKGWHVYWRNPGDSGMATQVEVEAPPSWRVGELRWPRPLRFAYSGETTYGYEGEPILFVPITPPADWDGTPVQLTATARWLVCRSVCLAGSRTATLSLAATEGDGAGRRDPKSALRLEQWLKRLPKTLAAVSGDARVEGAGERRELVVEGAAEGGAEIDFFPDDTPGVQYGAPAATRADGRFVLRVPIEVNPANALGQPLRAAGLLLLGAESAFEVSVAIGER